MGECVLRCDTIAAMFWCIKVPLCIMAPLTLASISQPDGAQVECVSGVISGSRDWWSCSWGMSSCSGGCCCPDGQSWDAASGKCKECGPRCECEEDYPYCSFRD